MIENSKLKYFEKLLPFKLLVGFSGGVDSSVLVFLLNEFGIKFDLAIVDYGIREQSKEEVAYAKELAKNFKCDCFVTEAPKFKSNFESNARDFRYNYFKKIANANGHYGVVLGHHLNDKVEWTLMQMTKGCGLNTISGFNFIEERDGLKIFRPMIELTKKFNYTFANMLNIKYFEDETNKDTSIKRNSFRKLAEDIVDGNEEGLIKTYKYLKEDKDAFLEENLVSIGNFSIINTAFRHHRTIIHNIDRYFKTKKNYVLSRHQRDEIIRSGFNININGVEIVNDNDRNRIFLFDQIVDENVIMPKEVKENFRINKIPVKMRKALYVYGEADFLFMENNER